MWLKGHPKITTGHMLPNFFILILIFDLMLLPGSIILGLGYSQRFDVEKCTCSSRVHLVIELFNIFF